MEKILIFLCIARLSFAQFNRSSFEVQYAKMVNVINQTEIRVVTALNLTDSYLKFASLNLAASKVPLNLTKSIDNLRPQVQRLATLKSHLRPDNLTSSKNCNYLMSLKSSLDLDIRQANNLASAIDKNLTEIYQQRSSLINLYMQNIRAIRNTSLSKENFVLRTISQYTRTANEMLNYRRLLNHNKAKFAIEAMTFVDLEFKNAACPVINSFFYDYGKEIDEEMKTVGENISGRSKI